MKKHWMWPSFIIKCYYEEEQSYSNWRVQGIILEDFHEHVATVDRISLNWVSDSSLQMQNK